MKTIVSMFTLFFHKFILSYMLFNVIKSAIAGTLVFGDRLAGNDTILM